MENTIIEKLKSDQKRQMLIIVFITFAVAIMIALAFRNGKLIQNGDVLVKNLQSQNKQLVNQNESLLTTVEKLNFTVKESVRQDSALMNLTAEQLGLLPGIDYKVSSIKKDYEKDAINYRNLDAREVESYITAEARRLRNE